MMRGAGRGREVEGHGVGRARGTAADRSNTHAPGVAAAGGGPHCYRSQESPHKPLCSGGHRMWGSLRSDQGYTSGFDCDVCRRRKQGWRWHCYRCKYDMCFDCWTTAEHSQQPAEAPVTWFWKSKNGLDNTDPAAWRAYPEADCRKLEAAHDRGEQAVDLGDYTVRIAYRIQVSNADRSAQRRVVRAVKDLTSAEGQKALAEHARTFAGPAPRGGSAAHRSRTASGTGAKAMGWAGVHRKSGAAAARSRSVAQPSAVEWYFKSGRDRMGVSMESPWKPYSPEESQKLEEAFQSGAAVAEVSSYVVYLAVMIQTQAADASRQRRVIRTVGAFGSPECRAQFVDYARKYKAPTAGGVVYFCPKEHVLHHWRAVPGHTCDACQSRLREGAEVLRCAACDWDYCCSNRRGATTKSPAAQLTRLEEGMQVECRDGHGEWWRIHVMTANADGTYRVMVYDGRGTVWEQVHIADCRPIGGGEQPPSPPAAAPQAPVSAASPDGCAEGWDAQDESLNLLLVELPPTSEEYKSVAARLLCSLKKATGVTITRIQNRMLHMKYTAETQIMAKWKGADPAERLLWHGTRGNHPKMIYNGQDGFDMRFSPGGLWGQATYFAERAAYSDGYVYQEGPKKMLILAQVLVGDSVKLDPDPQLRLPPEKSDSAADGGKAEVTRYDSVNGVTKGTTVYMVYANGRAYPRYLVQYTTG
eukprot:TRINITY_DN516_c0_g1_i7.p1 TRINITY_DN516_c0_g1~~TRINITY_DN516_c0_g1_i7.p1  ORF type:complete len:725 (+),score=164.92 TRINITY_DN516_c0_g1_i7:78-2177(+)